MNSLKLGKYIYFFLALIPFLEIIKIIKADEAIKWEKLSIGETKITHPEWKKITEDETLFLEKPPSSGTFVNQENHIRDKDALIKKYPKSFNEIDIENNKNELDYYDYSPTLRLGLSVPTSNQLPENEKRFSNIINSPFKGGAAGGTGNQNYSTRFDFGITNNLQISAFTSEADDPLYSQIKGLKILPANLWQSYGTAIQWKIIGRDVLAETSKKNKFFNLGLTSSLELWNVGSGGCDSTGCKGKDNASPNIFNDSGERVFTNNLIGSVALPMTFNTSPKTQLTITPGASFLPSNQGKGQGGEGEFYGNNIWLGAGGLWNPIKEIEFFSSLLYPFGPGSNSFDADLDFKRVPVYTAGLGWKLNPRIRLEGAVTNGWGTTPATSLLTIPSSNQLGYSGRFHYTAGAKDSPQPSLTKRQLSLSTGGMTVSTALVPPDKTVQITTNIDNKGNISTLLAKSLSNIYQVHLYQFGWFKNAPQSSSLQKNYLSNDGYHWRIGGKGVWLSQLKGDPIWLSARISAGRHNDQKNNSGYVFLESIQTYEFNNKLAINSNPKLAWNGIENIFGLGLSANYQLSNRLQLIPELNLISSQINESNSTMGLRWLFNDSTNIDLYLSNAVGLMDMGQMQRSKSTRLGSKISIKF